MPTTPVISVVCLACIVSHGSSYADGSDEETARIERWVTELASDDYQVRQHATRELRRAGARALPALARGTSHSSLEVRRRSSRLFFSALERAEPETAERGLLEAIRFGDAATALRAKTELTNRKSARFRGLWEIVSATRNGQPDPQHVGDRLVFFETDVVVFERDRLLGEPFIPTAYRIDPTTDPPGFEGWRLKGSQAWNGEVLTLELVSGQRGAAQVDEGRAAYKFVLKCLRRPSDIEPQLNQAQQLALAQLKAHRAEIYPGFEPAWLADLFSPPADLRQQPEVELLTLRLHEDFRTTGGFCMNRVNSLDSALPHLRQFPSIKELRFASRSLSDDHMRQIAALRQLVRLELSVASITDTGLSHLSHLEQLRDLGLRETDITDAGLEHLSAMKRLEALDLLGTDVTDAGLERLKNLAALRCLNLSRTRITDAGLKHLRSLPLRELDVCDTEVTQEGVDALQAVLPNCRIQR